MARYTSDTIDEYLAGRLDETELDEFELALIEDESLQQEVRQQIMIRDAMKAESDLLLRVDPQPFFELLDRLFRSRHWAYACTAALAILLPTVFFTSGGEPDTPAVRPLEIAHIELTRSINGPSITMPAGSEFMLSIDAYALGVNAVRFELLRDGRSVAVVEEVRPDDRRFLNVLLGPLPRGDYLAVLTAPEEVARIPVTLKSD